MRGDGQAAGAANPLRAGPAGGRRVRARRVFAIYGASGDLSQRKLLPAIYNLARPRPAAEPRSR